MNLAMYKVCFNAIGTSAIASLCGIFETIIDLIKDIISRNKLNHQFKVI